MENQTYDKNGRLTDAKSIIIEYLNGSAKLPNEELLENYIRALSLYVYNTDSEYLYNFPFLIKKHHSFAKFIEEARAQYKLFATIVAQLMKSEVLSSAINNTSDDFIIELSMNNFLSVDLRKQSNITICEPMSLASATSVSNKYFYTFRYGKIVRVIKDHSKENVASTVKKIISIMKG